VRRIRISSETLDLIRSLMEYPDAHGAVADNGSWVFEVDDELFDNLDLIRLPGESDDQVVARLIGFVHRMLRN
jgi:hypothetical protein